MALTLPASAPAQVTKVGKGYLFRLKFIPGKVYNYAMTMSSGGAKSGVSGTMAMKVLSVKGEIGTLQVTLVSPSAKGKRVENQKMTVNTKGEKVLGTNSIQLTIPFPEKPIRPGAKWSGETSVGIASAPTHLRADYKFLGIKKTAGRTLAEISIDLMSPESVGTSSKGSMLVLVEDGSIWSLTSSAKVNLGAMKTTMNSTMTRKL